jgi:hypothetical protein
MVRKTKINVVDLNEITSVPQHVATHIEITPEPSVEEEETPIAEEPPIEEPQQEEPKMKKGDEKATCAFCNKLMSVKALRYSHDKNCKGKQQPPTVTKTATLREESPPPNKPFTTIETSLEMPPIIKPRLKQSKTELKQQRINNLISQAF